MTHALLLVHLMTVACLLRLVLPERFETSTPLGSVKKARGLIMLLDLSMKALTASMSPGVVGLEVMLKRKTWPALSLFA